MCSRALIALLMLTVSLAALAAANYEKLGAFDDPSAPATVRDALAPEGHRAKLDDGSVAAELWLAAEVATRPKQDVPGALYGELAESTFIGVARFPTPRTDFRGRRIAPGAYTLRYAAYPQDGNHMGVSAYRDFLLLLPLAADADPKGLLTFEQMVVLSKKAAGANHPSVLSLQPVEAEEFPSVHRNDEGFTLLAVEAKTSAGAPLRLAVVVKGEAEQ